MDLVMVLNDYDPWNSLDVTTFNPPSPITSLLYIIKFSVRFNYYSRIDRHLFFTRNSSILERWLNSYYGDWEHVTLRINHSEGSPKLQSMYFAQHSGGYWYTPEQLTFEDGHPLVYVARFTHASYPNIGINSHGDHLYHRGQYGNFVLGHYSGWACDLTGNGQDGGKVFETLKEGGAEIISSNVSGVDVVEPDWLRFDGAFGQYLKSRYICQIDFGPFGKLTLFDKADVQPGMSSPVKNKAWSHGDEDKPPIS